MRKTSIYKRGSFIILGRAKLYNGLAQGPSCSSRTWLVPFPAEEGINLQKSYKRLSASSVRVGCSKEERMGGLSICRQVHCPIVRFLD